MNIYDTANQLERELRLLPEFIALKEAYAKIQSDDKANKLFTEFKEIQKMLNKKMMKGEMPNEKEEKEFQELAEKVNKNPLLSAMFQKESAFDNILRDIINLIHEPIKDIYGD